jgi:hypothetical protein
MNQHRIQWLPELQIIFLPSNGWNFCFTFDRFRVQFSTRILPTLTDTLLRLSASPRQNARPLTAEARVRTQASSHGICGGKSGSGIGFCPITSIFPCHCHSTIASCSLSPTLIDLHKGQRHSITQIMKCEDIRSNQPRPIPFASLPMPVFGINLRYLV